MKWLADFQRSSYWQVISDVSWKVDAYLERIQQARYRLISFWDITVYRLTESTFVQKVFNLGLSLLVGLLIGALIVFSQGLSSSWQGLIFIMPIGLAFVMLVKDLDRLVLLGIAVAVPINLDISLVISPYARNFTNLAAGDRTLITTTEMRVSLVMGLLVLGYALWLISPDRRRYIRFFPIITIPIVARIFISTISLFQVTDFELASFRMVQLIEVFLVYFYLINHLRTLDDLRFFLLASTMGLFAESVLIILQWVLDLRFFVAGIEALIVGGRPAGTVSGPGPAGAYLAAHLLICLGMLIAFPKKSHKAFLTLTFALGFIALVATGSRGGWLGFAVGILAFGGYNFLRGFIKLDTVVFTIILSAILGSFFFQPIYTRLTADDNGSADARPRMNRLAMNTIQENVWFGVGENNYALVARDYYTSDVGDLGYDIDTIVHNRYLASWAETGIFGLLIFLTFLFVPVIQAFRHVTTNILTGPLPIGMACAIIALSVHMITSPFIARPIVLFIWQIPAMIATAIYIDQTYSQSKITTSVFHKHHLPQ